MPHSSHKLHASDGRAAKSVPSATIPDARQIQELRDAIVAGHRRTTMYMTASAIFAIDTGAKLLEMKRELPGRIFLRWVETELTPLCGMSRRTAQRYMQLARNRDGLLGQIRRFHSVETGEHLDIESAEKVLATLRMKDALSLLTLKSSIEKDPSNPKARPKLDEVLTPKRIIDAAVAFLGSIDLDPCAESGPANLPAQKRYRRSDDGLHADNEWSGQIFVNPPITENLATWIVRAVGEYATESVTEAILLLPVDTNAEWMLMLDNFPRLFLRERLQCRVAGSVSDSLVKLSHPSCVVVLADPERLSAVHAAFSHLGSLFVPYSYSFKE